MAFPIFNYGDFEITALTFGSKIIAPGDTVAFSISIKNVSGIKITKCSIGLSLRYAVDTDVEGSGGTTIGTGFYGYIFGSDENYGTISWVNNGVQTFAGSMSFAPEEYLPVNMSNYILTSDYDSISLRIETSSDLDAGRNYDSVPDLKGDNGEYITMLSKRDNPKVKLAVERTPDDESIAVLTSASLTSDTGLDALVAHGYTVSLFASSEHDPATPSDNPVTLNATMAELYAGIPESTTAISQTFSNGSDFAFLLQVTNGYETANAHADISRAFANLHLSGKSTGGACFGGFCTSTEGNPKLETYYPIYAYAGIAVGGGGAYSTDEVDTGSKWIDGKTIYRKVVEFTAITNGKANDMAIGASGTIDTIVGYRGMGYKTGKTYYWSIPHYDTRSQYTIMIELVMGDAPLVRITPGSGRDLAYAFVVVEYTLADAAEGS